MQTKLSSSISRTVVIAFGLSLVAWIGLPTRLAGHSVEVHEDITRSAILSAAVLRHNYANFLSVIDDQTLPHLLAPTGSYFIAGPAYSIANPQGLSLTGNDDTPSGDSISMAPDFWIIQRSIREDDRDKDYGGGRSLNHFNDPYYPRPLDNDPSELFSPSLGLMSFHWASVSNCSGLSVPLVSSYTWNQWSWPKTRDHQLNGLTNQTLIQRNQELVLHYRSLGNVVHLLEDLTSPQHVRDEQHYEEPPDLWPANKNYSPFEHFGLKYCKQLAFPTGMLDWRGAGFCKMQDFWDRGFYRQPSSGSAPSPQPLIDSVNPSLPGRKLGLTVFTNGNFIGDRHTYGELVAPRSQYCYPLPSLIQGTDWTILTGNLPALLPQSSASWQYTIGGKQALVVVGTSGTQGRPVQHHGAVSFLILPNIPNASHALIAHPETVSINNTAVLTDYHAALIPEAIKYVAGLLDCYFRGQFDVFPYYTNSDSLIHVKITNRSGQAFTGGQFMIFGDAPDISGKRTRERLYVADTGNNRVLVITIPKSDPMLIWSAARQALQSRNLELALNYISSDTVDGLRQMFNNLGAAQVSRKFDAAGTLTPLYLADLEARYLFTITLQGQLVSFEVAFSNEYGSWKIRSL